MNNRRVRQTLLLAVATLLCASQSRQGAAAEGTGSARPASDFFCGPRCVQRVMRHFGKPVSMFELLRKEGHLPDASGTSISDLQKLLLRYGIRSLPVTLPHRIVAARTGPMIVHLRPRAGYKIGHWAVVDAPCAGPVYSVFYGLGDVRTLTWNEIMASSSGAALLTALHEIRPADSAHVSATVPWHSYLLTCVAVLGVGVIMTVGSLTLGELCIKGRLNRGVSSRRAPTRAVRAGLVAPLIATICIGLYSMSSEVLGVIPESALHAIRGGAPACAEDPACYMVGEDEQCGSGYQEVDCNEQECPDDGDCSGEIAIQVANSTVHTVDCQFGTPDGYSAYTSKYVVCADGMSCESDCMPGPNNTMMCQLDFNAKHGPIDSDWTESLDKNSTPCRVTVAPAPRSPRSLAIAAINGVISL